MRLFLEPGAWLAVSLFSAFGVLANLANYYLGQRGFDAVQQRFHVIEPEKWDRARSWYTDRGSWILILSAVPMLGLVLTTTAGALGIRRLYFLLWVAIGRLVRNWLVLLLLVGAYQLATG
jgi:membrane protein YqaA with SNARE-associated domain